MNTILLYIIVWLGLAVALYIFIRFAMAGAARLQSKKPNTHGLG